MGHNTVYSIFEDGGGNLWIGTKDGLNSGEKVSEQKKKEQPIAKVQFMEPIAIESPRVTLRVDDIIPTNSTFDILIVDDDPINLQVLSNHLSLQNYNIEMAANGPEAL